MKNALIYAAGFGTRMGELTKATPKPMLELNGKPLIGHVIEMLRAGGVKNFHVNVHYLGEQILSYFNDDHDVTVVNEIDEPFETGGTLKSLANVFPDPIITMNSDALFGSKNPVPELASQWNENLDALLLCVPVANARHYGGVGDFYIEQGAPVWRGDRETAPYVFTGLQIIRPTIALDIEGDIFSSKLIWQKLMDEGRIGAVVYDGDWIDIGTKEALESARHMMAERS